MGSNIRARGRITDWWIWRGSLGSPLEAWEFTDPPHAYPGDTTVVQPSRNFIPNFLLPSLNFISPFLQHWTKAIPEFYIFTKPLKNSGGISALNPFQKSPSVPLWHHTQHPNGHFWPDCADYFLEVELLFLSDPGVPGVRSMGPIFSHSVSHFCRFCRFFRFVTLADNDTNLRRPTDNANRAIQGNVAMPVAPSGGQIVN